jgi:hypothetical protein
MKSDEGFSNMLDKTILIDYQYEYVIPFTKKIQKGQFLLLCFLSTGKSLVMNILLFIF